MPSWRRVPQGLVLVAALVAGILLSPWLSGCVNGDTPLGRLISVITGDSYGLPESGAQELQRFSNVYARYASQVDDTSQLRHFRDTFKRARASYVHPVADAVLIDAAVKGVEDLGAEPRSLPPRELVESALDAMMASLDPHSIYLNPQEYREMQIATTGEFGGLGIEVTMDDETGAVKVVSPIEDTPAFRAGIQSGDLITHLDGTPIKGKNLMQAVRLMRGRPGTDLRLTIQRAGVAPFDVTITRAVINVRSVRWRTEGDIGYIRVVSFTEKVEDGVERAIEEIREAAGGRLTGIVLDLRNNPGGLLDQATYLADAFLEDGRIVSIRGRNTRGEDAHEAGSGDLAEGLPMVVLINDGSASASEIVAAALKFHGRATVMGLRSFGKGSVQTIMPMPIEGALRLTTALYYDPSGRAIQARGVVPDILLVPAPEPKATEPADGGAEANHRREADLPHALPAQEADDEPVAAATVPESACEPVGDREDRTLGCALALLRAGSAERFLAGLATASAM